MISGLREQGLTQADIGEKIGWSRDLVARYTGLIGKVVTRVLDLARRHQTGRVTENVTTVTFTEGWFRDSGGGTSRIAHRRTRMAQDKRKNIGG